MKQTRTRAPWVALLSLTLCALGTGCGSETSEGTPGPGAKAAAPPGPKAKATPSVLEAGDTATCEELEITLLRCRRVDEFTKTPAEGQGYAVLRFRVKNVGTEEEFGLIERDLQWRNPADGMRNGPESYTGVPTANPESLDLAPGAQAEFEGVYQFPLELSEAEFDYLEGYDPKPKATWRIPLE